LLPHPKSAISLFLSRYDIPADTRIKKTQPTEFFPIFIAFSLVSVYFVPEGVIDLRA